MRWVKVEGVEVKFDKYQQYSKCINNYLLFIKSVVKCKGMVLNIFCYSIDFEFRLMDSNLWISCWNWVDFSTLFLFLEHRSLPHTNSQLKSLDLYFAFSTRDMRRKNFFFESIFIDHDFEVNINIFPTSKVISFFFFFLFLHILHLDSTLFPFLLNPFDLIQWILFILILCFHFRNYWLIQIK